jgi:multiple antibiotic resistance protein
VFFLNARRGFAGASMRYDADHTRAKRRKMLRSAYDAFKKIFFTSGWVSRSLMLEQLLKFFVVFFVVVEPVSLIPVFSGLTDGASDSHKHKMALKSVLVAGVILVLFALGGATFLRLAGISIDAFRIFGGLLLFLIALEMVFARESGTRTSSSERAESVRRADISVFPLAFPFIAGPGALATILLWFGPVRLDHQPLLFLGLLAGVTAVLALALLAMWLSTPLMRVLGVTGANVANRLLGVILGALAVQFIIDGLRAVFM